MIQYSQTSGKYVHIWQKYRPVILQLMIAADKEAQFYNLSQHEFLDVNPKKKTGLAFIMRVYKNRAVDSSKTSILAEDLLFMLQHSRKSTELTELSIYQFELDKNFLLTISKEEIPDVSEPESNDQTK